MMTSRSEHDGPATPAREATLHDLALIMLAAVATFAFMIVISAALRDGDTAWHVATGRWIVTHRAVPLTDPFSFTAYGRAWTAHEWLTEVVMFLVYRASGWAGVLLFYAACFAALFVLVAAQLRRWMSPRATLIPLIYCAIGLQPFLLARPHLVGWVFVAVWMMILLRAAEARRAPPLAFALIIIVWANVHASFMFGLLLFGPFALEALIGAEAGQRIRVVWTWGLFGVSCLAAALLTPTGIQGLLYPFQVSALALLKYIGEWNATTFDRFTYFEIVLMSGLFFCLYKPVRIPVVRLLTLLGLLHMAMAHQRHQAVFVIVATMILAEPLGRAYCAATACRFRLRDGLRAHGREFVPIFGVLAALFAGLAGYRLMNPESRANSYSVPATAITVIPQSLRAKPVFNEYSFGGSLILSGIPVFIDGRSDMYGDTHTADYMAIIYDGDAERWALAQKKWHIAWTILPPDKPMVKMLDADPAWRRIYADDWAVIHVSRAATAGLDLTLSRAPAAGR